MSKVTIGGGFTFLLGLLGLALSLSDFRNTTIAWLLIIVGFAFFGVSVIVGAWRKCAPVIAARWQAQINETVERALREHLVREVRPWVKEDVRREIAEQKEGGRILAGMLAEAAPATDPRPVAEAALQLALNELLEELEYILDRIEEDDPGYWHAYVLPNNKWVAHGAMIGARDNRAHEALRAAYREADRISHCLQNQRSQVDIDSNPIGSGRQVEFCKPDRYRVACINAKVQIARMQNDLALGR